MINSANTFGGYFNQGAGVGTGMPAYGYQQVSRPIDKTQMRNVISAEEQDRLRKTKQEFSGKLSDEEYLRALCTHKDVRTGIIALDHNADGSVTCAICGENFRIIDTSEGNISMEDIEATCSNFNDIFQTIKLIYGAVPEDVGRQLYVIAGFIKKIPAFYKYAKQWFEQVGKAGQGFAPFGADPNFQIFRSLFHSTNPIMSAQTNPAFANGLQNWMVNGLPPTQQAYVQAGQNYNAYGQAVDQFGNLIVDANGQVVMSPIMQQQAQQSPTAPAAPTVGTASPVTGQAPTINYGAPVVTGVGIPGANAVGVVTPEAPAAPGMVTHTVSVQAPGQQPTPKVEAKFNF